MKPLNVIGFLFAALLSVLGPVLASAQSVELSKIDRSVRLHADTSLIITVPDGIQDVTIANPRIADFSVVSDTSLYLIGKLP
ncbi:MAG: pilus assembly protein N-terminal domain-containing protein, partial [Paracoccaceae bacterium]